MSAFQYILILIAEMINLPITENYSSIKRFGIWKLVLSKFAAFGVMKH